MIKNEKKGVYCGVEVLKSVQILNIRVQRKLNEIYDVIFIDINN